MKTANFLFCVVICAKTIKCSYSTQKPEYIGQTTTSNRLRKRQVDDDSHYDELNEEQSFGDPQKPGETNNGILFEASGSQVHSGILLAPPGHSRRDHPKPFESFKKNNKNNSDIEEAVDIISKCKHYKLVENFDFVLMADTWQLAYYISKNRLSCFKISLQSTTPLVSNPLYLSLCLYS